MPILSNTSIPTDLHREVRNFCKSRGISADDFARVAFKMLLRQSKFYSLDSLLQFGKYQGENLETVMRISPSYVMWCLKNIDGFTLDEGALDLLKELSVPMKRAAVARELLDEDDEMPF